MAGEAERERIKELRRRIESLKAVKSVSGKYRFEGTDYTKAGINDQVKKAEAEITRLERMTTPSAVVTSAPEREVRGRMAQTAELQKQKTQLKSDLDRVREARKTFEDATKKVLTVEEVNNLNQWISLFRQNETVLQDALRRVEGGEILPQLPTPMPRTTTEQARQSVPPGGNIAQAVDRISSQIPPVMVQPGGEAQAGPVSSAVREQQPQPSRMPSLEEVNAARRLQNLPDLVLRNGKFVEPTTGQEVPAQEIVNTVGQTPAGMTMVPGGSPAGGTVGGTPSGAVPPAAGTTPAAPGAWNIPADWEKAARDAYGAYYDVIKNDPEMRDFINRLMTGPQLSESQFWQELKKTNWWKSSSDYSREFQKRQLAGDQTLQTDIDNKKAVIRQQALSRGLTVDDATLTRVATDQIKFNWNDQVMIDYLGQQSLGTTEGAARLRQGFYGQQVREKAAQYGIPLSDVTFTNWVSKIATGSENVNSFEAYVREQAKVLYPALSNGLDRGLSFTDLTSPYAVQASRILEIPAEQIDFTDPRWARAFTSRNDKGEQIQMSYGEWADYLRSDPSFGWEYTDQAKSQAYDIALEIGRMFGRAG
jgi:hypothetical protein